MRHRESRGGGGGGGGWGVGGGEVSPTFDQYG